jgi:O-antigen ligase
MSEADPRAPAGAADETLRERIAQACFLLATLGAVKSPPVANVFAALGLLAYATVPQAGLRLRAAARRPLGRGILVLLGTLALAMFWAQDASWGARFASWWSWRPLLLVLVGSALFATTAARERYARWLVALLAAAAAASFVWRFLPESMQIDEPGILLRNHTTQGMAFVVGAAFAALLRWGRPCSPRAGRWLLVALALFVLNVATITSGRSAHVALLVTAAAGAFSLLQGRRRWIALMLVPLLGVALLASSSLVRTRFEKAVAELDTVHTSETITPMGIRIFIWQTTWEMIRERPLLGFGMGGFVPAYSVRIQAHQDGSPNWHDAARATDTHCEYLHVWVEAGLLGLAAFAAFVAGALRQGAPPPWRGFGIALLLSWLVTSLFNSHFQAFAEAHLLGLVLGVLLASDETPQAWLAFRAPAPR